jgi:hypothetical protein
VVGVIGDAAQQQHSSSTAAAQQQLWVLLEVMKSTAPRVRRVGVSFMLVLGSLVGMKSESRSGGEKSVVRCGRQGAGR